MHISSTSCLNEILGSQPKISFALVASPNKVSTSAGLKYLGLTLMTVLLVLFSCNKIIFLLKNYTNVFKLDDMKFVHLHIHLQLLQCNQSFHL